MKTTASSKYLSYNHHYLLSNNSVALPSVTPSGFLHSTHKIQGLRYASPLPVVGHPFGVSSINSSNTGVALRSTPACGRSPPSGLV